MFSSQNKQIIRYTLISLIIFISSIKEIKSDLNPDNVIIGINCGGDSFTDSKGVFYDKVKLIFMKF